jgi:hypothetical protein
MDTIAEIEARREAILKEMRSIRGMKRGSITPQYLIVPQKAKKAEKRGPYYVLSRRVKNRTVSQRLTSSEEVEQAQRDIQQHKRFVNLCREFEELTERLLDIERNIPKLEQGKKRLKSSQNKTMK